MIAGYEIIVDDFLAGTKCAYAFADGVLLVSPAIHDLISHATPAELEGLVAKIPVKELPFPLRQRYPFTGPIIS